uniref:Uncharacterized protein n=1 Tax=Ditylenchus dipsaci TaxID=166011 RepID=A0A915CSS8_9BILA
MRRKNQRDVPASHLISGSFGVCRVVCWKLWDMEVPKGSQASNHGCRFIAVPVAICSSAFAVGYGLQFVVPVW